MTGLGLAALYWWEVGAAGLLPAGVARPLPPGVQATLHLQFAAHCLLIGLMLAASMIDVDEKTIPDEITVAGTLVGLLLAAAWPWSLLPVGFVDGRSTGLGFSAPHFAQRLAGVARRQAANRFALAGAGLLVAVVRGPLAADLVLAARLAAGRAALLGPSGPRAEHPPHPADGLMGALAVVLVWFRGGPGWEGLLSALVGMAAAGGLIWAVRIIGAAALQREAMGFGDVTLMAMLGAFLGWQPCLVIFFLAPVAGLIIAVLRLILFRDREIPYGPFLCLAALFVIVRWDAVWELYAGRFRLGLARAAGGALHSGADGRDAGDVAADSQCDCGRRLRSR